MSIKSIRTGWTGISALAGNPIIGDFESIATVTVGAGGLAEIEFANISSSYQHLQIRGFYKNEGGSLSRLRFRLNSDTGTNYAIHLINGDGSGILATAGTAFTWALGAPDSISTDTSYGAFIVDILDYANTSKNTTLRSLQGVDKNGSGEVGLWSSLWVNTSAVTNIKMFMQSGADVNQHSSFALYGIR